MKKIVAIAMPALASLALVLSMGTSLGGEMKHDHPGTQETTAADAEGEATADSMAPCQLHGGQVTGTELHRFETVFSPDGIRVYLYTAKEIPMQVGKAAGTAALAFTSGDKKKVPLTLAAPKEGESTAYFCPGHAQATQMEPGICKWCGSMKLMQQDYLYAPIDLSKVEPGSMEAVIRIEGMGGTESKAVFTEAYEKSAAAPEHGHAGGHPTTHMH